MNIKTTLHTRILSCINAIVAAGFCATSMAAPFAYVPNEKSGTISRPEPGIRPQAATASAGVSQGRSRAIGWLRSVRRIET